MTAFYLVSIHSNISEFPVEKRYDPETKVSDLKKKLELVTGADHKSMKIQITVAGKDVVELSDDDKTLKEYVGLEPSADLNIKLVVNDDQAAKLLEGDTPKYVISDEEYQKRQGNARDFIKEMREKRLSGQ